MRKKLLIIFIFISTGVWAQNSCETAVFLRGTEHSLNFSDPITYFSFRAQGNLLKFMALLKDSSSVDYEIYEGRVCSAIERGYKDPIRSSRKGMHIASEEAWQLTIDSGYCVCESCLQLLSEKLGGWLKVEQGQLYTVKVWSKGQVVKMKMNYTNKDSLYPIQFGLHDDPKMLEVGMVYQFREVNFVPAEATLLPESFAELDSLKAFLANNEIIHIQVRGHVNGQQLDRGDFYQQLSEDRAKAIQAFLIENGVDPNRISIKGMANSQMRIPEPQNEEEAKQNRRVEIVITSVG